MTRFNAIVEQLPQARPLDEHNKALIENVHPPDWVNPKPVGRYNMVVLGAGTAGLVTAAGAAGLGAKVALVERALLGGDCLNVGCVPSKALIRCARAYADARDAAQFGVRIAQGVTLDFPAVMQRMRRLRVVIDLSRSSRAKTCGWRRTSLAHAASIASAIEKSPASSLICARKTTS